MMHSFDGDTWSTKCHALLSDEWRYCSNSPKYAIERLKSPIYVINGGWTLPTSKEWLQVCGIHVKKHQVERAKLRLLGSASGYDKYDIKPMNKWGEVEG